MGCDWPLETDQERIDRHRLQYESEKSLEQKWRDEEEWVKKFVRDHFRTVKVFTYDDVKDRLEVYYEKTLKMTRTQRRRKMWEIDARVTAALFHMRSKDNPELVEDYNSPGMVMGLKWKCKR